MGRRLLRVGVMRGLRAVSVGGLFLSLAISDNAVIGMFGHIEPRHPRLLVLV